ncbi:MAG TPA: hypothetical protein VFH31_13910 [Pyrinomonadaceae bacterium]|nr:hypothetical protein [Pyrinomonadaceae bacterium]
MERPKRITRLSIETERTYIFRSRDDSRVAWCTRCGAETEMATVAGASDVSGLSELAIYQFVESGALHFTEDESGRVLVCLVSLLK